MANQYINAMTDLWNSAGTTYSSIKMNVTNAASATGSKLFQLQIGAVDKYSIDKLGNVVAVGTITSSGLVSSGGTVPSANDSASLGASGIAWSDLFLASGGVINWLAGDVTITHAANQLLFAGAASGYDFDAALRPVANDAAPLGNSTQAWSDLYLATGAVINVNNGNWVATHSDAVLTVTTGDLRVTSPHATNATTVATLGATQTLTQKTFLATTLVSPTITTAASITGTPTAAGAVWTNLGAVTTCDINGGTIDGTTIGATTPAAITGTTITGTSASIASITASTAIESPTANFSSSVYGGTVISGQIFQSTATSVILAPAAGNNTIYFRPRGYANATEQVYIDSAANVTTTGAFTATGQINSSQNFVSTSAACVLAATGTGTIYFRPYGAASGTYQSYLSSNGGLYVNFVHTLGSGVATHSFYNGNGPVGASSWGALIQGNGASNVGAILTTPYPGAPSGVSYLSFHQPSIAYWSIYCSGPAITTSGWQVSDAKVKSNIKSCDCHDAYSKVKAIAVKSYRKDDGVVSRQNVAYDEMGFVAQELETVIPEAVMNVPIPKMDAEGHPVESTETIKVTNDRTLLGVLWAAVQHQAELIERLEERIEGKKK